MPPKAGLSVVGERSSIRDPGLWSGLGRVAMREPTVRCETTARYPRDESLTNGQRTEARVVAGVGIEPTTRGFSSDFGSHPTSPKIMKSDSYGGSEQLDDAARSRWITVVWKQKWKLCDFAPSP